MRTRWLLAVLAVTVLGACDGAKKLRNKECEDFSDWSNKLGQPLADAVPEAEKRGATTNEQQAAVCRKLAEGARKAASIPIPFTDPFVKGLAGRRLDNYRGVAGALDRQADAWAKGDKEALAKAQIDEIGPAGSGGANEVMKDWQQSCRVN